MTKAIAINQLTKQYDNGHEALKGISLTVEKGDFFALLGPNGAGKSTTIGVLTSLVRKTSGSVKIFDHDIDKAFSKAKSLVGVVPQEFNFGGFVQTEDVVSTQAGFYGIPRKLAKERTEYYLKALGLWDKRHVQSMKLSGGMKRRLMIARALIHEPELLILDEPTAGVDIEMRRSMWRFLKQVNEQGTTIILTTHYLEEAESLCRNIAIIDQGRIIQNSSMKSLLGKLEEETFIFDHTGATARELSELPFDVKVLDGQSFSVALKRGRSLNQVFEVFNAAGLNITSMRNKSNRLEELFVNLIDGDKDHAA